MPMMKCMATILARFECNRVHLKLVEEALKMMDEVLNFDIARHSELSHGVMQLTTIIADNVKRLPNPT